MLGRMTAVVRAEDLTKSYGSSRGVVGLDFEVGRGEVFGLLGPNGAGKTTTIRLLLDLIRPNRGRLEVFGLDAHRRSVEIRRRVGFLPGDLRLYERMTGRDLLRYFARLVNSLSGLVGWIDHVKVVSPFYYYAHGDPLRHGLAPVDLLVLLALALAAGLVAVVAFDRRDLVSP
jgi:ABC-type Fe3+/spermidine/putrescine transport system ATPase subunit